MPNPRVGAYLWSPLNAQPKIIEYIFHYHFDVAIEEDRKTLLSRVDIVPVSLFLAQAANESSWGTSRFARKANNLFAQWCYKPGCGLVPTQRAAGEKQEVRKFATVNDAVKCYVRNINSK